MDVKTIRNKLVQFIKDQLQRTEGGEGSNIKSLDLYISPLADDRHLYETAVYNNEPDRFRNEEVQRIADDYDIALSPSIRKSNMEVTIETSAREKNDQRFTHLVYSDMNFSFVAKNPARKSIRRYFTISLG